MGLPGCPYSALVMFCTLARLTCSVSASCTRWRSSVFGVGGRRRAFCLAALIERGGVYKSCWVYAESGAISVLAGLTAHHVLGCGVRGRGRDGGGVPIREL